MKNDPAFPVVMTVTVHKGITKREYFAAMAMQGLLANGNGNLGSVGEGYSTNNERIAAVCFYLADAMLAESEKSDSDK